MKRYTYLLLHTQASGNKELIEKSTLSELSTIEIIEGAKNNLPDEMAQYAASRIKEVAESMSNQDILLVLISGGGSALLPYPVEGITLEEKLKTIKVLASRGATIHELNTVRKNLSDIKGGKLAEAAFPAKVYITHKFFCHVPQNGNYLITNIPTTDGITEWPNN